MKTILSIALTLASATAFAAPTLESTLDSAKTSISQSQAALMQLDCKQDFSKVIQMAQAVGQAQVLAELAKQAAQQQGDAETIANIEKEMAEITKKANDNLELFSKSCIK